MSMTARTKAVPCCMDCGKRVSHRQHLRCQGCNRQHRARPARFCIDCRCLLLEYRAGSRPAKRCSPCDRQAHAAIPGRRVYALAPEPTEAMPGTERKIEVLAWRMANGYRLYHPQDARGDEA